MRYNESMFAEQPQRHLKMSYLEKMDGYLDSLKIGKSALVDSWFMMSSPTPILMVVTMYLLFVRLGPAYMKKRPPMQLNKIIMYYNLIQVVLSIALCYKALHLNLFNDGLLYVGCRYPSSTQSLDLLELGWWYFFAKFTELLDTVFFILRKKDNQVTFLHVYHHGVMALYSWSYLKFAAGGEGAVLALLNSFVHVVMYSYYLLAAQGPRFQKYLWWKKYVTSLQMSQFLIMLVYCIVTHFSPRCQFAPQFTYFCFCNVSTLLFLFYKFYYKSYKLNKLKQNGVHPVHPAEENTTEDDTTPCEAKSHVIGDYCKNGKMLLTRRTAKAAYGVGCNFNTLVK